MKNKNSGLLRSLSKYRTQIFLSIVLIVTFLMAHYRSKLALKDAELAQLRAK